MMNIVHYDIHVTGKVQGVWFRKYTKDQADRLGLKGFVRNEVNGNVYIEAEGNQIDISDFIEWLHTGSPGSNVSRVDYELGKIIGFADFKISS